MLGELFAGLGLGTLSVLGSYFVQTGSYSHLAMVASIPSLILTHNLLFLNEFPDVHADRKGGRRNLAIFLGRARASKLYSILTISVFGWIIAWTAIGLLPKPVLVSLLILPVAIKAIKGALAHHSSEALVPALAANVLVVLITQALMGAGFIIASLFKI
jgi:1,4-dihydroxy-2-naphthoate octaprenyltransferase